MAGTKLLNCFVKLKDTSTYNGYFRVIRQDESLCTILNLDDKCIKLHKHIEELKKVILEKEFYNAVDSPQLIFAIEETNNDIISKIIDGY